MQGYDEKNVLLLPPRAAGESLPEELQECYLDYCTEVAEKGTHRGAAPAGKAVSESVPGQNSYAVFSPAAEGRCGRGEERHQQFWQCQTPWGRGAALNVACSWST